MQWMAYTWSTKKVIPIGPFGPKALCSETCLIFGCYPDSRSDAALVTLVYPDGRLDVTLRGGRYPDSRSDATLTVGCYYEPCGWAL